MIRRAHKSGGFLWEPAVRLGRSFSPVIILPGFRQYQDNDFQFLVPIGEDSVGEDPPPEELPGMREEQSLLDRASHSGTMRSGISRTGGCSERGDGSAGPRGSYYSRKWTSTSFCGPPCPLSSSFHSSSPRVRAGLYVRPVAGLRAVDDAVGRAAEMGRPILFSAGFAPGVDASPLSPPW